MKSESINELAAALAIAQSEIKSAHKDTTNPFFKSKYADLTSVWDACREALNENGLSIIQTLGASVDEPPFLETTLLHTSGQWISGRCPLLNQKGDMQGLGSAISYARRYSLASMVGVVAEDDDGNLASEPKRTDLDEPCTPKQANLIKAKLANANIVGLEAANLLNKFGTHLPERIPFIHVNDVLAVIEAATKKKTDIKKASNKGVIDREEEPPFDPDLQWSQR